MSLGKRLKMARKAAGYTQKSLAASVGISPSAIANYETGVSSPNEDILINLMKVLDIDANFLYADDMISKHNAHFLSPEEEQLITLFRSLNSNGQDTLISTAESFALNPAFKQDGIDKAI